MSQVSVRQILEDTPDRSLRVVAEQLGVEDPHNRSRESLIRKLEPLIKAKRDQ